MKRIAIVAAIAVPLAIACSSSNADPPKTDPDSGSPSDDAGADAKVDPPCPSSGVDKGPWSLGMSRTGGRVRWEACRADAASGIVVKPEAGGAEITVPSTPTTVTITTRRKAPLDQSAPDDVPGTYFSHEATMTGLAAGTCYRYELVADRSLGGRFCTSQPDGGKVHFLAIGDTNPMLGPATGNLVGKVLPRKPDFTIHGGDIQYYASGLETWAGWFPLMRSLLGQGAMMAAIGNHEYELDRGDWEDYSYRYFGDGSEAGNDSYFHFESGGVHFFSLNSEVPDETTSAQGKWLLAKLDEASKSAGYRTSIIFMHRPWVTCGDVSESESKRKAYASIFVQAKVSIVFQAHLHAYERFDVDGLTWITTGGGGARLTDVDANLSRATCAQRKSKGAFFHAIDVVVDGKAIHADVIDDVGAVRDSFDIVIP